MFEGIVLSRRCKERHIKLSVKSKYYKDRKISQEYTDHEQKGAKTKPYKKQTQKPYLLPNQVRKSKTEFVLSTLYRLAQIHKLETKLVLILWADVTSFSNTNLFLARQRVQNRHKGAAIHIFLRFLPTTAPCQAKRV